MRVLRMHPFHVLVFFLNLDDLYHRFCHKNTFPLILLQTARLMFIVKSELL